MEVSGCDKENSTNVTYRLFPMGVYMILMYCGFVPSVSLAPQVKALLQLGCFRFLSNSRLAASDLALGFILNGVPKSVNRFLTL